MNRQPKSKLDLVLPNLSKRDTDVQDKQKQQHDQHAKCQSFNPGTKYWKEITMTQKCGFLDRYLMLLVKIQSLY